MPKVIAHRELRNNSSEILRQVRSGETFHISNNGEVVAVLSPADVLPGSGLKVKRARIIGGFEEIPSIELDHPIQETLDYLRGEK
ncbi:MAG TPA: type II toxin-antitoxin system prevent-host-death family antitoxin [Galbitalea sp.]|jgi:prevent-host-death family protein|nr:type II toxin-antitoxin system prevent-host-death family antitoxin [Galbitalea sp.]